MIKNKTNWNLFNIIATTFVISIVVIIFVLRISECFPSGKREIFVSISSSLIGGLATLFGVLISVKADRMLFAKKETENKRPEFYVPIRFDIFDAVYIKLDSGSKRIGNNTLYFKNSDKTSFILESIIIDEEIYKPAMPAYIDKKELFCLNFYRTGKTDKIIIKILSLDNKIYEYTAAIGNNGEMKISI